MLTPYTPFPSQSAKDLEWAWVYAQRWREALVAEDRDPELVEEIDETLEVIKAELLSRPWSERIGPAAYEAPAR